MCFFAKKKKGNKKAKWPGLFQGQTCPIGSATPGFSQLLGTIRNSFKLEFYVHCMC
jgi:hypothetical protein